MRRVRCEKAEGAGLAAVVVVAAVVDLVAVEVVAAVGAVAVAAVEAEVTAAVEAAVVVAGAAIGNEQRSLTVAVLNHDRKGVL